MVAMVLIVATTTFVHAQPRPDELPSFRFGGGLVDMGVNVGPYRLLEPSTSVGFDLRMRWLSEPCREGYWPLPFYLMIVGTSAFRRIKYRQFTTTKLDLSPIPNLAAHFSVKWGLIEDRELSPSRIIDGSEKLRIRLKDIVANEVGRRVVLILQNLDH